MKNSDKKQYIGLFMFIGSFILGGITIFLSNKMSASTMLFLLVVCGLSMVIGYILIFCGGAEENNMPVSSYYGRQVRSELANMTLGKFIIMALMVMYIIGTIGDYISLPSSKHHSSNYSSSSHKNNYSTSSKHHNTSTSNYGTSSKPSSSNNNSGYKKPSSSSYYNNSYDKGYDDVYEDEDYDWDRYQTDRDYANGVDDAMDDAYDDFGDDW